MADDKKISSLPDATLPLNNADLVEVVQGGANKKAPKSAFGSSTVAASAVSFTPAGNILATDVQAAIQELDTEKERLANKATDFSTINDTLYPSVEAVNDKLRGLRVATGTGACVQTDDNLLIVFNSASNFNFTIDQLTAGSKFSWININTGIVTFVNGSGVTIDGYTTGEAKSSPYIPGGQFYFHSATDVKHLTSFTDSWQNFSPTYTGFSADPTGTGRYYQQGKFGAIRVQNSPGTSNATDFTLTMPFVAATRVNFPIIIQNNGVLNFGRAETTGGSNVLTLYVNAAGGAWTNSGSKGAFFSIFVEIQ